MIDLQNLLSRGSASSVRWFACRDGSLVLVGARRLLHASREGAGAGKGRVLWQSQVRDVRQCLVLRAVGQDSWFLNLDTADARAGQTFRMGLEACKACAEAIEARIRANDGTTREASGKEDLRSAFTIGARKVLLTPERGEGRRREERILLTPTRLLAEQSADERESVRAIMALAVGEEGVGGGVGVGGGGGVGVGWGWGGGAPPSAEKPPPSAAKGRGGGSPAADAAPEAPPTPAREPPPAAAEEAPAPGKYERMLKVGVPLAAVRRKMVEDGASPAAAAAFGEGRAALPAPAPPSAAAPTLDPKYAKYCKMLSVGVPRAAVERKMLADGLTATDGPPPGAKAPPPLPPPPLPRTPSTPSTARC